MGPSNYNMMFPNGTGGYGGGFGGGNELGSAMGGADQSGGGGGFGSNFNVGGAMLGGGLAGLLGGMFGSGPSPSSAANQYLNQMPGAISPYMSPYMQAGGSELGPLSGTMNSMISNPGGYLNQMGSNFHSSPGFNFAMRQAMMGGNQASAAGGMAGSPEANQLNQQMAGNLANQNYYNYTNQAQSLLGQGLQGGLGLAGLGMQGGTNMASLISSQLGQQAADAYQQQAAQNQAQSGMFGDIGAGLGAILPML